MRNERAMKMSPSLPVSLRAFSPLKKSIEHNRNYATHNGASQKLFLPASKWFHLKKI
jgi:hypothetical protein